MTAILKIKQITGDPSLTTQDKCRKIIPELWDFRYELDHTVNEDTLLYCIIKCCGIVKYYEWGYGCGEIGSTLTGTEEFEGVLWELDRWCKKNNVEVLE